MKQFYFLVSLFLSISYVGFSQQYDLKSSIKKALQNNYLIKNQNIDNQINLNNYSLQRTAYNPHIKGFANYYYYPGDLPLYIFPEEEGSILSEGTSNGVYPVPLGLRHNYMVGINFEQTLFDADFFLKNKSSNLVNATNQLLTQKVEGEVIYSVAKAYFEILRNQKKGESILFNQKRLDVSESIIRKQIQNEMAPQTDLEEISLKKKKLRISYEKLISGIEKQENYLKFLMGIEHNEEIEIVWDFDDFSLGLIDSLELTDHPNNKLIEKNIESNQIRQKVISNEKLPELKAYANLIYQSQGENINPFGDKQNWYSPSTIGLTLSIPIMNGSEKNTRIENLKLEQLKSEAQKAQNDAYLQMMYDNAITDLEISKKNVEEKNLNLELQQRLYKRKQEMFAKSMITINDLLEAEAALIEAENEQTDAKFDYLLNQIEVLKTTGNLKSLLEQ